METRLHYSSIVSFDKELKRLCKKFPSLIEDLEVAKTSAIELFHIHKLNNQSIFPIPGFCTKDYLVYKVKKFACKSLKGRGGKSGIRIIYFFDIAKNEVVFLEMYFKSEKEVEDRVRIKEYLRVCN